MSVIIRLQNLPWSANALDIRHYFNGLSIPEGGVHIVGGELGDAFIAFSTDEDARQAFTRNNGKIKEIQITLMLSSRTEMQRVIELARSQSYAAFMQPAIQPVVPLPAAVPSIIPQTIDLRKETKEKDKNEKRDSRKKSRSRSKERSRERSKERDRSRDRRDRRHRRSRSRSRDRKSNRRRDRSRSRGRSRSRDRKSKEYRKRSEERTITPSPFQRDSRKNVQDAWSKNSLDIVPPAAQGPKMLGNFTIGLNQVNRSLDNLNSGIQTQSNNNGVSNFSRNNSNSRDSWPPSNENSFQNRPNFIDRDRDSQDSFQNRFQRNNMSNPRGMNNRHEEPINCCVAVDPFHGSYAELRRFFHGMFINSNGIKFINDNNGRGTGVVFVRFTNRKFKEEALRLDGERHNGIPVGISHIGDEEFDDAVDRFNPRKVDDMNFRNKNITKYFNSNSNDTQFKNFTCLTVDDLPNYCKEQDILHMFSQHPLVALILTAKKKGGHIAYVKFSSPEVAKKAIEEKSLHVVGGKQVSVKPCNDEQFDDVNKQHEVNLNSTKTEDIGTDCLSVSKLPEKTNDKDIADFFSDIGVIPTKIHLMSNNLGFTGQAYCEFATVEEASRAARKNDTSLGNASISVLPMKREEMESILGTAVQAPDPESPPETRNKPADDDFPQRPFSKNMNISDRPPFGDRGIFGARPFDNMRGPRFGARGMGPRPPRFGPPKDIFEDVPPGCTVFMKNVPYKANTNDILNFFDGFNHTNNVSRRYNANNTPSDEAKIIFFEADEASRAVRELQKMKIWERQIFLRQE